MAQRVAVEDIEIAHDFEAHTYTGDDGCLTQAVFSPVAVKLVDGRQFVLFMGERKRDNEEGIVWYKARYDTSRMMERIRHVGSIDPDFWVEVDTTTLEERFAEYAFEEQMERFYQTGSVY